MDRPDYSPLEWAILALGAVVCIGFVAAGVLLPSLGWKLAAPAPALAAWICTEWHRRNRIREMFRFTLTAAAKVVDYHVETRRCHHRYAGGKTYYKVWKPVVEFETDRGTVKAEYPIWSFQPWYADKEIWEVHYVPEQPELFYFTERAEDRFEQQHYDFRIAIISMIVYLAELLMLKVLYDSLFGM